MHLNITTHREDIVALCQRFGVRRLDVFGSATTSAFDELSSDVDFLVEFDDPSSRRRTSMMTSCSRKAQSAFWVDPSTS